VDGGHPYRTAPAPRAEAHAPPPVEEIVAYVLAVAVGAIPVAGALEHGGRWGAAATVGVILAVLGTLGLGHVGLAVRRARRSRQTSER
jgi:hypothetical protein